MNFRHFNFKALGLFCREILCFTNKKCEFFHLAQEERRLSHRCHGHKVFGKFTGTALFFLNVTNIYFMILTSRRHSIIKLFMKMHGIKQNRFFVLLTTP